MSKLTKSAKGQLCQMRIPNACTHDPEKVALCHIRKPFNAGTGMRPNDLHAFFGCSVCHDIFDGRQNSEWSRAQLDSMALDAHLRTLTIWQQMGLV